ncbi:MAG: dTDP-4-dehydrorhamnose reductase [Planctomycetes bacterium]|nr:dTDP-4-dehydrorhamnose reductase [Planctomycetota bacterium]
MTNSAIEGNILVTGAAGMLGSQVLLAAPDGVAVIGTDLVEAPGVKAHGVDLSDPQAVKTLFAEHGPFAGIIHTAAYTAVDKAEEEPELAMKVNGTVCGVLAEAAKEAGIPLVIVGTDFVFNGKASEPYTEDFEPDPISVYGETKYQGEVLAFAAHPEGTRIVRTQWLYGPRGKHFPATMLALAKERDHLKVVSDQRGSPTSTLELAPALWDVLQKGEAGVYHAACEGDCSWFDLASATLELSGVEGVTIEPCSTDAFPRPAPRPEYSVLSCKRLEALRGAPLAHWRDALSTYLGN